MKRIILLIVFLCVAVSAQAAKMEAPAPPGTGTFLEIGGPLSHDSVYNIKDFGAKGDGVTGDNAAIIAGIDFAVARWTADNTATTTLYFPAGDYALFNPDQPTFAGGILYVLPNGFGGLTILGDGGAQSRLLWTGANTLYLSQLSSAIKLQPDAYLQGTPVPAADRIHDISFVNIGVFDDDPDAHEVPAGEETHGIAVLGGNNITFDSVKVDSCGDEYMVIADTYNVLFTNCIAVNDLYTGYATAGTAGVNITDGCKNVVVQGCRLFSDLSAQRATYGIHFEALDTTVAHIGIEDVTIVGNTIQNCLYGIVLFNGNGPIENVAMSGNIISNCDVGIRKDSNGKYNFKNITIANSPISNVHTAIEFAPAGADYFYVSNISIVGNTITDVNYSATSVAGFPGVAVLLAGQTISFTDNEIDDCEWGGVLMYDAVDVTVRGGHIKNTGAVDDTYAAIDEHPFQSANSGITVDGVTIRDAHRAGIESVSIVKNCDIQVTEDATASKRAIASVKYAVNNIMNYPAFAPSSGCQYIGNRFVNSGSPEGDWINAVSIDGGVFVNNYFEAVVGGVPTWYAIQFNTTCTNCILTGNNAAKNNNAGNPAFYYGNGAGNVFTNNIGGYTLAGANLLAAADLPANTAIMVEGDGGAVTCTATPSIADGTFIGQEMTVIGEDDTNHWTIQDDGTLAGSNVQLGAATRQIDDGDVLMLKFDGAYWQETLWVDN